MFPVRFSRKGKGLKTDGKTTGQKIPHSLMGPMEHLRHTNHFVVPEFPNLSNLEANYFLAKFVIECEFPTHRTGGILTNPTYGITVEGYFRFEFDGQWAELPPHRLKELIVRYQTLRLPGSNRRIGAPPSLATLKRRFARFLNRPYACGMEVSMSIFFKYFGRFHTRGWIISKVNCFCKGRNVRLSIRFKRSHGGGVFARETKRVPLEDFLGHLKAIDTLC
jgi:hypothetical protein